MALLFALFWFEPCVVGTRLDRLDETFSESFCIRGFSDNSKDDAL